MTRIALAFVCVLGTVGVAHADRELNECRRDADCDRGYVCTRLSVGEGDKDGAGFCQASWGDLFGRIEIEPGLSAPACTAMLDGKSVACDANGSFLFEHAGVGKHVVRISVSGYLARTLSMWVNPGRFNDAGTILVRSSAAADVRQPAIEPAVNPPSVQPVLNPRLPTR